MEMMDPFDHRNNLGKNCFGILPLGAELAAAFKRVHDLRVFEVGKDMVWQDWRFFSRHYFGFRDQRFWEPYFHQPITVATIDM